MCVCVCVPVHLGVYRYMAQTNQNECLQFLLCAVTFFFSLQSINREWNSIGGKLKQTRRKNSSNYWSSIWLLIGTSQDTYIHFKWISSKNVIVKSLWIIAHWYYWPQECTHAVRTKWIEVLKNGNDWAVWRDVCSVHVSDCLARSFTDHWQKPSNVMDDH